MRDVGGLTMISRGLCCLLLARSISDSGLSIENQLTRVTRLRRKFVIKTRTLMRIYDDYRNGTIREDVAFAPRKKESLKILIHISFALRSIGRLPGRIL